MSRSEQTLHSIIVFDGVCVLCNGWVKFLLKHDKHERYKFASMQSDAGRALLSKFGLDPDDPNSFLLLEEDAPYTDSTAILRVLSGLGGLWRLSKVFAVFPRVMRDPAYRWLAKNRYQWFGKRAACMLPDPASRDRFL